MQAPEQSRLERALLPHCCFELLLLRMHWSSGLGLDSMFPGQTLTSQTSSF